MAAQADTETSGLDAVLRSLWRRKAIVVGVVVLIPLLAGLGSLAMEARYRAAAEVMLEPRAGAAEGDRSPGASATRAAIASQVEALTARGLLRRVVERADLLDTPAFNPSLRPETTLLDRLGLNGGSDRTLPKAVQQRRAVAALRERLTVRRQGRSQVARIAVTAPTPELAARVANTVASTYIDRRRALRQRWRERATGQLADTVTDLRGKVRAAEDAVAAYREKTGLTTEPGAGTPSRELAALTSNLASARAALAEAEARVDRAEDRVQGGDAGAAARALDSPLIQKLRIRVTELRAKKAELNQRYAEQHPKLQTVTEQLDRLRSRIDDQVARVVDGLRSEAEVARQRVERLEAAVARKREQVSARQTDAVKLQRLQRAAEAERKLFTSFLARLRKADSAQAAAEPGARVLAEARPPLNPSAPNRTLIVALAVLTALPCGVGLALFVDHRDAGVASLAELEQTTGARAVALLPRVTGADRHVPADHLLDRPASAFAEGVQALHTGLDGAGAPRAVMVTSAQPQEGKSSLALAYGRLLARQGASAVLVEADLRRPGLAQKVRAPETPGVGEVLTGAATPADALRGDPHSALTILPAGAAAAEPGDILASTRVADLIRDLAARFDHVIVDVPPVIPVADARRLAPHVDAAVMAVRWRRTRHTTLNLALHQLAQTGAPIRGAVLTRVDRRRHKHFGAGEEVAYGRESRAYYSG
ncbi:capsular exopolysaccharide family [Limimonas halophila]|uniref:Capsular exopolysaccharide family n=1 Tax=Limimonas halophila TaxID=1082479 RepID=A0A1G7RWY3_9PROT|nr:GNVR domain-containing protein [Limimonas halophila]SDG15333.1 capsular exopolysaccharide family [Limimonas halophila]